MINKLKNNNKGEVYLVRVLCYFILIIAISFMLDVVILLAQNVVTSYEAAYYAEKVSIQGGILGQERTLPGPSGTKCTSCMINAEFSERISKTFSYFKVSPDDWIASISDANDIRYFIHIRGNATRTRQTFDYMDIGVFHLTSEFKPKFASWLWGSKTYLIEKSVPFVVENIPK